MYKYNKKISWLCVCLLMFSFVNLMTVADVKAAYSRVYFGSELYSPYYGEEFPIGVYIESDDTLGDFEITLSYDTRFLEYTSGATSSSDGEIVVSGYSEDYSTMVLVNFKPIAVGDTSLNVVSAKNTNWNGTVEVTEDELLSAPISIVTDSAVELDSMLCNGEAIEGFSVDVFEYDIVLPYADELKITSSAGDELQVEIVDSNDSLDEKTVYATYVQDDIPVTYVLNLVWDMSEVEEATEEATTEEQINDNETVTEEVTTEEQKDDSILEEKNNEIDYDLVDKKIKENRNSDIVKGIIVLGILLIITLIVICLSFTKKTKLNKSTTRRISTVDRSDLLPDKNNLDDMES